MFWFKKKEDIKKEEKNPWKIYKNLPMIKNWFEDICYIDVTVYNTITGEKTLSFRFTENGYGIERDISSIEDTDLKNKFEKYNSYNTAKSNASYGMSFVIDSMKRTGTFSYKGLYINVKDNSIALQIEYNDV
jgi:hypothetical protein